MKTNKFIKDSLFMGICVLFTICSILIVRQIDFEKPKVCSAISESVTVHNLKVLTNYRLCSIVIGEEPIISFHGLFEIDKKEDYLSIKYNQNNIQYVYFMFPKGEVQFFSLVDNIPNNDYLYTYSESYKWEEENE